MKAFYDIYHTPESRSPPEDDIEVIINSLNAIPQSSYRKGDEFLRNIQSDLKSYPAKNPIRQHVENAATMMAFFEQARSDTSKIQKLKKVSPNFKKRSAEIGQQIGGIGGLRPWRHVNNEQLQKKHHELMIKSIRELDSSIVEKLKSYCNNALKELKESGMNLDNVVWRHIAKAKIMIDVFEATGGETPSREFLLDNPWITTALDSFAPKFWLEMVYLDEFANLIRRTK